MDISKELITAQEEYLSSEDFKKYVSLKARQSINSIVDDMLRPYGKPMEILKERMHTEILGFCSSLTLSGFYTVLVDTLSSELNSLHKETVTATIHNRFQKFFGLLENKKFKLSDLFEKYKENVRSEEGDEICEDWKCLVDAPSKDGYFNITFSQDGDHEVKLRVTGNLVLWGFDADNFNFRKTTAKALSYEISNEFHTLLLLLVSNECKLILDEQNVDTDADYGD